MLSTLLNLHQTNNVGECNLRIWKWNIMDFISPQSEEINYAVLILNRPIIQDDNFIVPFWNKAVVRMTVDGGTRHWDSLVNRLNDSHIKIPDLVTGDFDSVDEAMLQKYRHKGSKVIHTPDQNHTDFTKALMELNKHCIDNKICVDHVVVIAQASGRIDQILGNIQTLFLAKEKTLVSSQPSIYLMTDDAISWLLFPGEHCIQISEDVRQHKKAWCSLVPVGEKCVSVTTTGLKWNLDKQPLSFGGIVSTSNTFSEANEVKVACSHTLLWSMKIPQLLGAKKSC